MPDRMENETKLMFLGRGGRCDAELLPNTVLYGNFQIYTMNQKIIGST